MMLGKYRRGKIIAIGVTVVALLGLMWPIETQSFGRLASYMFDLLHFPLMFIAVFVLIQCVLDKQQRRTGVVLLWGGAILAISVCIESIQPFFGREADLRDVGMSIAGVFAGVVSIVSRDMQVRWKRLIGYTLVVLLIMSVLTPAGLYYLDKTKARHSFPLLASFESWAEISRWELHDCLVKRSRKYVTHGEYSACITVQKDAGPYPGVFLIEAPQEWEVAGNLCLDLYWSGQKDQSLWIRVDDAEGNPAYENRFQKMLMLTQGMNRISVDKKEWTVTSGGRQMNMDHIVSLGLFFNDADVKDSLYVDHIRILQEDAE